MNSSLRAYEYQTISWDKLHAQLNIFHIHLINITNKWCDYSQPFTVITENVKQKLVREVWQKNHKPVHIYSQGLMEVSFVSLLTKVS